MKRLTAIGLAAGLIAGCQTSGGSLATAQRVLDAAHTGRSVVDIARSPDPERALKEAVRRRGEAYGRDPRLLLADLKRARREYDNLVALLTGRVGQTWGKKEVRLPTTRHYVKYTQNYRSRAIVDFDSGEITVETVDEQNPAASLRSAVVTTLLTPEDPRATDLFTDSAVKLSSDREPYLLRLVVDQHDRPIAAPEDAERFADHLIGTRKETRAVEVGAGRKTATLVRFTMVSNFRHRQAEKLRPLVTKYAGHYRVSPSLVYAIIRTESNFNPFAVSSVPAYGLMQLVPVSGGREAYRRARGEDKVPSREYLFEPENNIELGAAYLNVLSYQQLEQVQNSVSREYCVISAYNTGPSNVLRAFSKDPAEAVNIINRLQPPELYRRLRARLPYGETRQYLHKVVDARREFLSFN